MYLADWAAGIGSAEPALQWKPSSPVDAWRVVAWALISPPSTGLCPNLLPRPPSIHLQRLHLHQFVAAIRTPPPPSRPRFLQPVRLGLEERAARATTCAYSPGRCQSLSAPRTKRYVPGHLCSCRPIISCLPRSPFDTLARFPSHHLSLLLQYRRLAVAVNTSHRTSVRIIHLCRPKKRCPATSSHRRITSAPGEWERGSTKDQQGGLSQLIERLSLASTKQTTALRV
jgi:hypothetical protein